MSVYGDMEAELNHMLQEGEKIMEGCVVMWRNTGMTTDVKVGMLESIGVPTVLYG